MLLWGRTGMLMIPVGHKERDDEKTEGGYRTQIV
jgi:hypothetical protein